jgi:hypothetical protein
MESYATARALRGGRRHDRHAAGDLSRHRLAARRAPTFSAAWRSTASAGPRKCARSAQHRARGGLRAVHGARHRRQAAVGGRPGARGPIYLCIAAGFASVRLGLFSAADMRVLGRFVIQIALPALLFNALASRPLTEVIHPGYLLAYTVGSLALLLGALAYARRVQGKPLTESAYVAMGMTCSNSGYVGYPVMLLAFGPLAGVILALNLLVENLAQAAVAVCTGRCGQPPGAKAIGGPGAEADRRTSDPQPDGRPKAGPNGPPRFSTRWRSPARRPPGPESPTRHRSPAQCWAAARCSPFPLPPAS